MTAKHLFEGDFDIGERVFHRCAIGRIPGLVTGVHFIPGSVKYHVSWGDNTETMHYALELSREYVPDFGATDE